MRGRWTSLVYGHFISFTLMRSLCNRQCCGNTRALCDRLQRSHCKRAENGKTYRERAGADVRSERGNSSSRRDSHKFWLLDVNLLHEYTPAEWFLDRLWGLSAWNEKGYYHYCKTFSCRTNKKAFLNLCVMEVLNGGCWQTRPVAMPTWCQIPARASCHVGSCLR